jgi:hypothetical protein
LAEEQNPKFEDPFVGSLATKVGIQNFGLVGNFAKVLTCGNK